MKLKELFEEEIRTAISITSANLDAIRRQAYRGIPESLWENTTPRTEVASFAMKDPSPEVLKLILDDINTEVSSAFMKAIESANKKYNK